MSDDTPWQMPPHFPSFKGSAYSRMAFSFSAAGTHVTFSVFSSVHTEAASL